MDPGQQDRLIVSLLGLRTPQKTAHFPQADSLDLENDVIRRAEMALKLDLMAELAVRPGHVARALPDWNPTSR
ncbi:hypothetical protein [Micromonospora sp. C51]|uniref:hypothetical protein n=1 Tax=Micromonospora sp. C51 TaxID=2824879 RepID=UPI001FFD95B8|nr:hypothetical protein [Micromonospora sp. C51]